MTKNKAEVEAMYIRLPPEKRELVDRLILQLLEKQRTGQCAACIVRTEGR